MRRVSLAAAVLLCLVAGCGNKAGNDADGTATEVGNSSESDQGQAGTDNQGTENQGTENQGTGDQNSDDQNGDNGGGNAAGAPKPHKGGGAKGAPIKLPARVQDSGANLDEEIVAIRGDIIRACGGSVCVRWRIVQRKIDGRTKCLFDHIEPRGEPMVERGSTFRIVVGSAACEDDGDSDDGDQSGDSGDQAGSSPSPAPDQPGTGESPS